MRWPKAGSTPNVTTPENTPQQTETGEPIPPENLDVDVTGYSVPPSDDPDNPETDPGDRRG
ncbi:hypothetical protein SAMN05421776_1011244 [Nocardia farcinica]|uniref:Uncharacterized protein n=1 Tax=Nocardia farcinica TaxID=37329 RepID=A0A0H5NNH3_NOCFR|nr:hypothetical protein CJ469_00676 [Nocardia farcinica]PFX10536.1 hypothetical protein CJ468_00202 [Nocardia farcinica]CRY76694.1 Uncharacterised protein [Nocardia farcinica]SIS78948.1 hypothetical protein SAMN05421776_1011244 [Nocardia farcinica]SUE29339.1 Uncharacterised protein [Nocardia farcinica]